MVITGTYNLSQEDYWRLSQLQELYLECDTTLVPVVINLCPIADLERFWNVKIYISDLSNNAFTNNITINCDASDKINLDGQTSQVISQNGGSCYLAVTNENTWVAFISYDDPDGYTTVQDEGVSLPQRSIIDFQGPGVVASDNGSKTIVNILAGNSFGLFAQTANSTPITATTAELSLIDGGIGSLSVPANGFQVGASFRADFGGIISAKNNDAIRIRVKSGALTLLDSGLQTLPTTNNAVWSLSLNFTIRQIGVATVASIVSYANFLSIKQSNATSEGFGFNSVNNTTFDTTIVNTLNVTAQWSSNSALNNIYSDYFTLYKIF